MVKVLLVNKKNIGGEADVYKQEKKE